MYKFIEIILDQKDLLEMLSYVASIFTFAISIPFAVFTYWKNVRSSKRDLTLAIIEKFTNEENSINLRNEYCSVKKEFPSSIEIDKKISNKDRLLIRSHMNQFEDIAMKVKVGIIDERILKNMLGPIFIEEFEYLSDFIDVIRMEKNSPSIMEHWEWVVKRWN